MKDSRLSLTLKKTSGFVSFSRAASMAAVRRAARASQSSSTSRAERKFPVVSKTWDSTIKKPEISCVSEGSDASGNGVGRIRSDCAYGWLDGA